MNITLYSWLVMLKWFINNIILGIWFCTSIFYSKSDTLWYILVYCEELVYLEFKFFLSFQDSLKIMKNLIFCYRGKFGCEQINFQLIFKNLSRSLIYLKTMYTIGVKCSNIILFLTRFFLHWICLGKFILLTGMLRNSALAN